MKKRDLLKTIDSELLDSLYGFCYARTNDSAEAQELCSDIVFELVKTAGAEGEIGEVYPFIWRVARNVYADFCREKSRRAGRMYPGDFEEALSRLPAEQEEDGSEDLLRSVYRRMSFLTRAYREVMISFYIDGLSTAQIAARQSISETAVRQRLFSARKKIQSEVTDMTEKNAKPLALDNVEFEICGSGDPAWHDPRKVCTRQFSKQVLRLCQQKPRNASQIAEELGVPTVYVEEELAILTGGEDGSYGLLRRLDSGKYGLNIVLLEERELEEALAAYTQQLPGLCADITAHLDQNRGEYLAFPWLNHRVDMNLILWRILIPLADNYADKVEEILREKYFSDVETPIRPFTVYGHLSQKRRLWPGWNRVAANNICGYREVHADNISQIANIKKHFDCSLNLATDLRFQLALRAIEGLKIGSLSETEREHAAKAVECGYLCREDDTLYTKILTYRQADEGRLGSLCGKISYRGCEEIAEKLAGLTRRALPDYLLGEWRFVNVLAGLSLRNSVAEHLIEKGILTPPADGMGAEGCWMSVTK